MTFQSPWLLLGLLLLPLIAGALRGVRAAPPAGGGGVRGAGRVGVGGAAAARAGAGTRRSLLAGRRDGGADRRAGASAGDRRRAGRAGDDRAGDGPLRLDDGHRRRAVAAGRGARRGRGVPRQGARSACGSAGSCSTIARRRSHRRPPIATSCESARRGDEAERRHGHRRRARHLAGDGAHGARAGGDRAPVRRRLDARPRSAAAGRRGQAAEDPDLHRRARHAVRARCRTATRCRRTRRRCARSRQRSGGQAFTASEADALSAVYEKLGSEVATKKEKREVTAGFAGGAALLLLMGGGLSLKWFRRLL